MFYFYALPAEPFLILAVVFSIGMLATTPRWMPQDIGRLQTAVVLAGTFVILVVLNFAYFFPIYSGESISTLDWARRMWLGNRWS
jgi:dolichyl-phosphate-mannose--protein O-mannosyl transferase